MKHLITFIGFGEAASSMARDFHAAGLQGTVAYDVMADDERRGPTIRSRAEKYGVALASSAEEACEDAAYIITFTSPAFAVSVAEATIPKLKAGQVYVDVNSTSPDAAKQIANMPHAEGVGICDGAALGNVQKLGCRVPITVCGTGAAAFKQDLTPYGMSINALDAPVGSASAMKMLRSVISKGMQQLMLEFTMCAARYQILPEMMEIVNNKFKDITLEEYADEAFIRFARHAARREAEANNIVETIEAVGLDASMSRATAKRFRWLADLDVASQLGPDDDLSYQEVLTLIFAAMEKRGQLPH